MPKSAQEHLFGAHHFGVVSLRSTFYLLIVPLPHRGICKGAATPVVAPFWVFFGPCVAQEAKRGSFSGPALCRKQKRVFFGPCVAQEAKRGSFSGPALCRKQKGGLFRALRCAGSKKGLISRGGKAFHETGDWLCDFRRRFRATPYPRDSAPSVHSHFHAYFCRSFG